MWYKLLFLLLLLQVGCRVESRAPMSAQSSESEVLEVVTAVAEQRKLKQTAEFTGTLVANTEPTLSAEVEGRVKEVLVDVGDTVVAGQPLVKLDDSELRWKLDQAEATLAAAEARLSPGGKVYDSNLHPEVREAAAAREQAAADYERARRLVESGDISRQAFEERRSAYEQIAARYENKLIQLEIYQAQIAQAKAQVELARKQLADSVIRSPQKAAVCSVLVAKGEYLSKGRPVVRLQQLDPLILKIEIPERYLSIVKAGQKCSFQVESFPGKRFDATITRLVPQVTDTSRTFIAEATVANPNFQLKPGQFAKVVQELPPSEAIVIPQSAVIVSSGVRKAFVVKEGIAVERILKLGRRQDEIVEVLEGISAGEYVVTSSPESLTEGVKVRVR
ncbi:MAG: efflux RND transporter periplasmic adaptor subunit [Acidobacteriota bacterium]|nr:efflux RND transporter periplasmic adaptor subunit [Blastocatellia bacterium]MDW8413122.1 efflux RND transporter periplasmic adaptor subunit [Acidobacteriota bacterium]